ncbi:hypothetical protein ACLOJK_008241 [Asimina triloba]
MYFCKDMFVAGTDTTSATLEWAMTELARHPQSMKKVQEEVRQVAGRQGRVEEDAVPQLHYMKAVIKETLRLHPPIPAKTRVLINTYAIGRDPQNWDEPLEFKPERFIGSDIDIKGQDFELLPFGGGRRGCPGYTFGLATIEIALARLLYHFDWKLPEGVKADDVDLGEIFGLATRKRKPLVLVPISNGEYKLKERSN